MEYNTFLETILCMTRKNFGETFTISLCQFMKINNRKKDALVIRERGNENQWNPVLYMEPYFTMYKQGKGMEECVMRMKKDYWESIKEGKQADMAGGMEKDWEQIKPKIYPFVISRLNNEELLESLVHREWLDLAVCYMVRLDARIIYSHFKISKNLCQSWGVDEEALYQQAMENMKKDGYTVTGMESIIGELDPEQCHTEQRGETEDMYIVTNAVKWYGAAGLLRDVYFLCHKFGPMNFYILPSSIHEIILVPDRGKWTAEEISGMVREVNKEQVLPEERLADHAYYYDWSKGKIQIVE